MFNIGCSTGTKRVCYLHTNLVENIGFQTFQHMHVLACIVRCICCPEKTTFGIQKSRFLFFTGHIVTFQSHWIENFSPPPPPPPPPQLSTDLTMYGVLSPKVIKIKKKILIKHHAQIVSNNCLSCQWKTP